MNQDQSFGQFVRQRRRELDLTQEELARRVGCAAITIRKIEADDARPSVQIAERLAMALAIPLDDRADFVRRARAARPEPVEISTPAPALEEIGLEDLSGRAIRGYALAEKIGAGGMGAVYRAMQPLVEREVAIKIILPAYANHPDFIRRFEAEAQLVARLEHPHIVPLYDYWREPGIAYLVMRLLRGGSVSTLLKDGALPIETINRLLAQICYALHAAHRIGVIHRDLKPANVLLDEDHNAYLADFGIAKNLGNPNLVDQTNAEMVLGSPAYFSPEQIRSATVSPQTDIYALGVMLYELLTGTLPFIGSTPLDLIQQHIGAPMPPLAARREGLPAALDAVICRAAAKDAQERYPDALALLADFHRATSGVSTQLVVKPAAEEEETLELVNPYKGLRAFGEADVDDYFGRETLIQQLLARLGEGGDLARFLAVIGPSGSGKSSVVKAGLIPALRRGALLGSENWFVVDFLPGTHPFEELEAALLRVAVNPPESLLSQLIDGERGLLRAVQRVLPGDNAIELVLVIDQFEEVFTLVRDEAERALFLRGLVTAVLDERSRVRVIVTLRADFTDRPLRYVDFGELVQRRSEFVLPLTPDELERAIVGPARRVGLHLESGLSSTMIHEVGDQPGALPLLQYALTELFEKRVGRTLTKAAYESIGGVSAALGGRAEEVYQGLSEVEQALTRQVFLRLVTLGEGVDDTRRRVLRSELESIRSHQSAISGQQPATGRVIDTFGQHRLLTFDRDPIMRGPTVEVAHEALLREWPRLREWLNESRADVRLQRSLAEDAAQWEAAQRDASYLLIGAHLEQFEGWASTTSVSLNVEERAFLDASVAERDRQQNAEAERQRRELEAARQLAETERARADSEQHRAEEQTRSADRLHARNRIIAAAGMMAVILAALAGIFGMQASQNATRAETNFNVAQADAATAQAASGLADQQRAAAVDAQATAVAESQVRATQQALAEVNFRRAEAQRLAAEAEKLLQSGGNSEQIALLSLRSINTQYTPQGDAALAGAARLDYPQHLFIGHTGKIEDVAYSPDGKYILTGSDDKTARLWDAATSQEVRRFVGHADVVDRVAFSPDGKYILTGSADKTARLWEVSSGQEVRRFTVPIWLGGVTFSPDGKYIFTGGGDKIARLWDAATSQEVRQFIGHTDGVTGVAFSPDGKYVLTGSLDKTARLWDTSTGQEVRRFIGHTSGISSVAFSPDGRYVATGSDDGTARLWNAQTGQELHHTPGNGIQDSVAFSPDGKYVVLSGSNDNMARLWDVQTGQEVRRFTGHTGFVSNAKFSPDGKHIVTGSWDKTARLWDVTSGSELPSFNHTGGASGVAFSPDGKFALTGGNDGIARLWDAETGQEVRDFIGHTDGINYGVAFSPDDKYILTGSWDKTVRLWDPATGRELRRFTGADFVNSVAFSPDGKLVLAASDDNMAWLWDAANGQELRQFIGHTDGVNRAVFSPDGKYIATASKDSTARLWDTATGQELRKFIGHTDRLTSVAFSPDGKYILTGSRDNTARLWDAATGQEVRRFIGHTDVIWTATFSPDGRYVATASADGTARLWDTQTGQELRRFVGHTAGVENVTFSPNGKHALTGSDDGTARLWDVDYHDTLRYLCSRLLRDFSDDERALYNINDKVPTCSKS